MNNQGWICPKCGMVHNPNVAFCPCSMKMTCFTLDVSEEDVENILNTLKVFKNYKNKNIPYGGM